MGSDRSSVPPPPLELAPPPPPATNGVPPPPPEESGPDLVKRPAKKPKSTPIDVDELLKKKKAADLAASKLIYVSKAERERRAAERVQKEASQKQQKQTNGSVSSKFRDRRPPGPSRSPSPPSRDGTVPTGPRKAPTGPAAMRAGGRQDLSPPAPPKSVAFGAIDSKKRPAEEKLDQAQAEYIKQRYMGPDQNVSTFSALKKRKRTTEKKFNFGWNDEEDTSRDSGATHDSQAASTAHRRSKAGPDDDAADEVARRYAAQIKERDKETGVARAQQYMDMYWAGKDAAGRMSIDKHWSEKKLEHMRERDWRIFKEDFNIATKGGGIPNPMRNWDDSNLPRSLRDVITQVGYTEPSAVQRAAIPIAMQNRDLIGVAVTGSGKTAAFLLPLLVYIAELPRLDENEWRRNNGPYSIILAPTRELAQQIELEARKFATPLGFTVVSIVGGHSIEEQAYNLRNGAEIIIATPGRLVDCIERRIIVLEQCCYVIMDEADRMIDLGFEEPVNKILDALPVGNEKPDSEIAENPRMMSQHLGEKDRYRQTMMYTATMPSAVERIARKYLRRPAIVTIGNVGEAVETVEQRVEFVSGEDKRKKRLQEILYSGNFKPPIIVFVNIKRNCDAVARDIKQMGFNSVTLHGSKTQEQREAALLSLREGRSDVLVATDLAGRGIDVPDVSLVVNFNMAMNIESYTHRIGRTGRAGKSGIALTFLGNEDNDVLYDLKQMLMKSEISKVPEELRKHEAAQQKRSGGYGRKPENKGAGDASGGW